MGQVSRRAANALGTPGVAPGPDPTSGGPSGPISGPPGRPYSGAPVSGSPVSPGTPAGTRVMPGYQETAPQRAGQYARGAASVPAAAPAHDSTGYGYTETGSPGRGGSGKGAAKNGRQGKSNVALWAFLAVVIVLVFCGGGGWLLLRDRGGKDPGAVAVPTTAPPAPAPTTTTKKPTKKATNPPTVKTNTLDCDQAQNKDADAVRKALEESNYKVRIIKDQPGGKEGRVAVMSPCGRQPEGTEVTLRVFTGQNGNKPDPENSCNPFDPENFPTCLPR
jgi:hypothetical protein